MDEIGTRPGALSDQGDRGGADSPSRASNGESEKSLPPATRRTITSKRVVITPAARRAARRPLGSRVPPGTASPEPEPESGAVGAPIEPSPELSPEATPAAVEPVEVPAPAAPIASPALGEPNVSVFDIERTASEDTGAEHLPSGAEQPAALVEDVPLAPMSNPRPPAWSPDFSVGAAERKIGLQAPPPPPIEPAPLVPAERLRPASSRETSGRAVPAAPPLSSGTGLRPTGTSYVLTEGALAPVHRERGRRSLLELGLWVLAGILLVVAALALVPLFFPNALPSLGLGLAATEVPPATSAAVVQPTGLPSATATVLPTNGPTAALSVPTTSPILIPTPPADGLQLSLLPNPDLTGWFDPTEAQPHYGDANLHAGSFQGKRLSSIVQFNLRNLPTDSQLLYAALELTGRDASRLDRGGEWQIDLIENSLQTDWANATPEQLASAKSLGTIVSGLGETDLGAGRLNQFILDDTARQLLQQQFKNGNAVLRLTGPATESDNLFTWESGTQSNALAAPTLHIVAVPGHYVIVTSTPVPQNVLTAAVYVVRGTDQAKRRGTPTPFSPGVATATPGGERVPVAAETALPGNEATAVARAILATAIAQTTGTYTPTPKGQVIIFPTATPVVIDPNQLSTATPIPPDTDLLTIPIDYNRCQCRGRILLLSNRYGDKDLAPIMLESSGQELGKLSGDLYYKLALAREPYSPDRRRRIIYPVDDRGIQQVGFENLDTQEITFITHFSKGVAYDAAWSPDGNYIALVATERANTDEIYVYDFGTDQATRITDATDLGQPWSKHPSWSPDSQQIVFWSSRSGKPQIWVMNRDGTAMQNISQNTFDERDPVWVK